MEKNDKHQLSFSTYEAYKKIKKDDPLKMVFESIEWSSIESLIEGHYYNNKELIYSPISLFKAQLLIYLGEAESNRDLAEKLRFNTRYCVLCGFHQFLKTPAHSTFSRFRKKIGMDLFHKAMHRIVAQSLPMIVKKYPDISANLFHIAIYSKDNQWLKCNCKGKCKFNDYLLKNSRKIIRKNFVFSGFNIKLFIQKNSLNPFAAEIRPK